ncbi:MAG: hypothetical protein JWQ73_1934 [Variovorax sp.]|jgi:hypothetical protein|nr:hypothetical protein [Variovorax sp.]
MKICVLNLSGNVGKSTLPVHLLAAYSAGARIVSVESVNATAADDVQGLEVEALRREPLQENLPRDHDGRQRHRKERLKRPPGRHPF